LVLAPGNRADLLVRARAGSTPVRTLGVDRGGMGMMGGAAASGPATLATLVVAGGAVDSPTVPAVAGSPLDLRDVEPARRRTLAFTMGMGMGMGGGMTLGFNGEEFDPDRIDQDVEAGAVEEWTLVNPTPMDHPFHLHVWPMQVLDGAAGGPVWRDVVRVPAGGTTVVRIAFETFTGTTVYHCHILDHEDAGMMGTVRVTG
jgi:FtsP/CotA-like multicopper oxidase with cupredoxin domain